MKDMLIILKFSCLFLHISKYGVLVNYFDFFLACLSLWT